MYLESRQQMPLLTRETYDFLICFDENIITKEEGLTMFTYEAIRVPVSYDYSLLVSTIIKEKYPDDKMQAIINNHLLEDSDPEHEAEYNEMQEWRRHAKEVAKNIIDK